MDVKDLTEQIRRGQRQGLNFGHYCQCLVLAKGDPMNALGQAKFRGMSPVVVEAFELTVKAAVIPGTAADSAWAGPLVIPTPLASEYINLIAPLTVLGRLPFRPVPFNVRIARATSGTNSGWIGEGTPISVSKMSLDALTLGYSKAASIVVITDVLAKDSSPAAAAVISADMARAAAKFLDTQLLDPDVVAVGGVNPASITNGAQQVASSGSTSANVISDLKAMFTYFTDNGIPLRESTLILPEHVAIAWASLVGSGGSPVFPNLGVWPTEDADIWGVNVTTSPFLLPSADSPQTHTCVLVHPDSVMVADLGVDVSVSQQAAVEMDSTPSDGAQQLTSLFQNNLVGLRSIRYIDWTRRRDTAVCVLTGVTI